MPVLPRLLATLLAVFAIAAATAHAAADPPRNPYLADSPWPIAHHDSYAQDSSALPGPTAATPLRIERTQAFPGAITLAYGPRYRDGSWPVWGSSWIGVFKAVQSPSGSVRIADSALILPDLSGGLFNAIATAYAFADRDGSFFAAGQRAIRRFRDSAPGGPAAKMAAPDVLTLPDSAMAPGDVIAGMNLTYDGHVIVVSKRGSLMAVNRDLTGLQVLHLPDEEISNSIAIDEDGGVYVVSERTMRRVQWTGSQLSTDPADGAWAVAYDGGPIPPAPGRLGPGSGTTPTLLGSGRGDKLVAIADGGALMHVNYFWRDRIPAGWKGLPGHDRRFAADLPITFGDPNATRSVTDQSFVGRGYDVMTVSNTYGFPFNITTPFSQLAVLFSGQPGIQPFGVQKFRWDPRTDTLVSAWANRSVSRPNGIPAMSAATNLAYCWGSRWGWWSLEALDWDTGASVFSVSAMNEAYDNSAYAGMQVGHGGTAVTGTLGGLNTIRPAP